ncbi:MAG: GNAT family N-acetyltransferase [Maricaulaceae bacterium]|nr:GNAT family N-acetyltransferase [Maricaulaceae bacterium]
MQVPDIVIETPRLILRPPDLRDFEPMCAVMADETAARFIGGVQPPELVWRSLAAIIGHWAVRGYGFFSVEDKASGDWAGRAGPWFPHGWPSEEVGWTIAPRFQGRGYATEAAAAAMDWAFGTLGWTSVIHLIHADNLPSAAVARKLGSGNTGRRAELAGFGVTVDVWGQSREDWRARRRA